MNAFVTMDVATANRPTGPLSVAVSVAIAALFIASGSGIAAAAGAIALLSLLATTMPLGSRASVRGGAVSLALRTAEAITFCLFFLGHAIIWLLGALWAELQSRMSAAPLAQDSTHGNSQVRISDYYIY